MIKYGILGAIFVLVATAVVATFQSDEDVLSHPSALSTFSSGNFEQRLGALEQALAEEQQQRVRLESQLATLIESRQLQGQTDEAVFPTTSFPVLNSEEQTPQDLQQIRQQIEDRRNTARGNAEERQIESLIEAGFDPFQAEQIIRRTEEIQMDLLNARFQASQNGEQFNAGEMQAQAIADLRASLGDADYERYLAATNQSTSVGVNNVLASSPAEISGMQSGDQIVRYNGERVFNTNDLNRLTNSSGTSGNVIVEVIRDGESVSLSLPSGPIGIISGRNGFNRSR